MATSITLRADGVATSSTSSHNVTVNPSAAATLFVAVIGWYNSTSGAVSPTSVTLNSVDMDLVVLEDNGGASIGSVYGGCAIYILEGSYAAGDVTFNVTYDASVTTAVSWGYFDIDASGFVAQATDSSADTSGADPSGTLASNDVLSLFIQGCITNNGLAGNLTPAGDFGAGAAYNNEIDLGSSVLGSDTETGTADQAWGYTQAATAWSVAATISDYVAASGVTGPEGGDKGQWPLGSGSWLMGSSITNIT